MNRLAALLTVFLVAALPNISRGALIIDTGLPHYSGYWEIGGDHWYAVEFTNEESSTINSVQSYLHNSVSKNPTTFDIAIYGDGGEVPDSSHELYRATATAPELYAGYGWYGLSGLNWSLSAGTFWVAFEVQAYNTLGGFIGRQPPNPLFNFSFKAPNIDPNWIEADTLDLPLRINVVPIPGAAWLLGSGIIGLVALHRKLRK